MNLYTTCPPADFLDYVNPPSARASRSRSVQAADCRSDNGGHRQRNDRRQHLRLYTSMHAKTGIANRRLKPTLGLSIPKTLARCRRRWPPPAASIFSATPSSYSPPCDSPTVRSRTVRAAAGIPGIESHQRSLVPPSAHGSSPSFSCEPSKILSDDEARANMLLAASYAGVGFGNAGVHLPHGMSYPVSGLRRTFAHRATPDHPLVPHGISVILNAPAVFRFTAAPIRSVICGRPKLSGRMSSRAPAERRRSSRIGSPGSWNGSSAERLAGPWLPLVRHSRRWSKAPCRSIG